MVCWQYAEDFHFKLIEKILVFGICFLTAHFNKVSNVVINK